MVWKGSTNMVDSSKPPDLDVLRVFLLQDITGVTGSLGIL